MRTNLLPIYESPVFFFFGAWMMPFLLFATSICSCDMYARRYLKNEFMLCVHKV